MIRNVRRDPGNKPARAVGSQNTLKIMYPATSDIMPVEVPISAWVRYTDASGKGLAGQQITPSILSGPATVPPGSVTTDGSGWASFEMTFTEPGTATLKVTANNNQSDTDQAMLTASKSAGGPGVLVLDDTPIYGDLWTMIQGTYLNGDGTPAQGRLVSWEVTDVSQAGTGPVNPTLKTETTFTNDDGKFSNFVLTSQNPNNGTLRISISASNVQALTQTDTFSKTYQCNKVLAPATGVLDLQLTGLSDAGVKITGTLTRNDGGPVSGVEVVWSGGPTPTRFYRNVAGVTTGSATTKTITDEWGQTAVNGIITLQSGRVSNAFQAQITIKDRPIAGVAVAEFFSPLGFPSTWQREYLRMSSPGTVFTPDVPLTIEVTLTGYEDLNAPPNETPLAERMVYWSAEPAERFSFAQPFPTKTDADGKATMQVTALGSVPLDQARIVTRTVNLLTGQIEEGTLPVSILVPTASITITSDDAPPLELYKPHKLTATYNAVDNKNKTITWSVDPEGYFDLTPDSSTTSSDGEGRATTTVTAYGPNLPIESVTVYARTSNDGEYDVGATQPPLSFKLGTPPDPTAARIALLSLDGDPLTAGDIHLIQATYTTLDGTPIANQRITWTPDPGSKITLLTEQPTVTNEMGEATNGVKGDAASAPFGGSVTASAINPFTRATDQTALALSFQSEVNLSDSIGLQLTSNDPSPLTSGERHKFSVSYAKNKDIHWAAFPSDRITFLEPDPSTTDAAGQSTMLIEGSGNIDNAIIAARSFNPLTGTFDHAEATVSFKVTAEGSITVTPGGGDPHWWFYEPWTLTATYEGGDPGMKEIVWSTGPEQGSSGHTFTFDRNPTPIIGGKATTVITAFGPNVQTQAAVAVYARSGDPNHFVAPGQKTLNFLYNTAKPPATKLIDVVSLDGDPLASGQVHVIQATYINADGTPVANAPLTWKVNQPSVTLWAKPGQTSTTDANGVMTNVVQTTRTDPFEFTVTVSADGTGDLGELKLTFQANAELPGAGSMTLTSQDADPLTIGDAHEVSVKYLGADGNPMPNGIEVTWAAFPSDRLSFVDGDKTKTSGDNGVATNHVIASSGDAVADAVISTTAFNPNTGANDHGNLPLEFKASVQQPDTIVVSSPDTAPLYAPFTLTAEHTGSQETVTNVDWSVDPGQDTTHTFTFDPPRSPLTGNGGTTGTTQIKGLGLNADVTVTVYARPNPPDPKVQLVPKTLTFKAQDSVPAGASVNIVSVGGDPLQDGVYNVFSAAYLNNDGTKATTSGWDGTITWGPLDDPNYTWLTNNPTLTDARGIATNALMGKGAGDVSVTAQATGTSDKAPPLTVTFVDGSTQQPGQGTMTITSGDPSPLSLGEPHPFTVKYIAGDGKPMPENTPVYWYSFPKQLTFGTPNPTRVTGGQGYATNTVIASGATKIDDAYIWTSSFNAATAANDEGQYGPITFEPAAGLTGIWIDKAYAQNPPAGFPPDATFPEEVIKCQVQVLGQSGPQIVLLPTDDSRVTMYDAGGTPLPKDPKSGDYYVTTQPGAPDQSVGTFCIGSTNYTRFTVSTRWQEQPQAASAVLVIATNDKDPRAALSPPTGVNGPLSIPPDDLTFKVTLPVSPGSPVALLLNDRLIYQGSNPSNGVDVAYAALNLGSDGNALVYVGMSNNTPRESKPLFFTASGTAKKDPTVGSLPAPSVVVANAGAVGPGDIMGDGLEIDVPAYPGMKKGDLVTLYCYLSGTDVLSAQLGSAKQVWNVVALPYTIGQSTPPHLPQWAAAGYSNGQLKVNYQVNGQWSQVTTLTLNTTF